ncbi:MAG TPA: hypothetical protein VHC94_16215 [Nitrobacter sp.]|jgi:hypothetical protein|nr:hypothetical protein [Nitrobacter sp.]
MRTLTFVLTFAFAMAGPSLAGDVDSSVPGVGAFAYSGAPIAAAPQATLVAVR